jgi:hypothetical protein
MTDPRKGVLRDGSIASRAVACLAEHGPQTANQVAEEIGAGVSSVSGAFSVQRGIHCHIVGYERAPGFYGKARAIYAHGPGRDKKLKPARYTPTELDRRYRGRLRSLVNSVWALGQRVDSRRVGDTGTR